MLKQEEKQELRNLSKKLLGSDTAWRRFLKGVPVPTFTKEGFPARTEKGLPLYRSIRKSEPDILADLRAEDQRLVKEKLESISGKV